MSRSVNNQRVAFLTLPAILLLAPRIFAADRGPINSGETHIGLNISVPSPTDTWWFEGNVGDRVIITAVTTSGSLDTMIYLYPPGGGPAEADSYTPYLPHGGDKLDWQLKKSGLYTIVIEDYGLSDSGSYNITFLKIPGAVSSPEDPDGGAIASGETLSGTINVRSDLDAFQFYGDVNDRVIITAVTTSGSLDTMIYLYPPGGGPAEADSYTPYLPHGGDRLDCQLKKSGLYTIVIEDYGLSDSGSYNTSLSKIPPPARGLYDPCPSLGGLIGACCFVELRWQAVAGATGYDVYFGTIVIQALDKIADNQGTSSVPMPQLQDDQVYYWYVVAHTVTKDIIGPWWWFATYAADFDQNGIVNFLDFAVLASHWQQNEPLVDIAPSGGDGIIDFLDVERLSDEWLYTETCY